MSELFYASAGQVGTILPLNTIESDIALLSFSWIANVPSCLRAFAAYAAQSDPGDWCQR